MKLIIDIDDDYYEIVKHEVEVYRSDFRPFILIAKGTPLTEWLNSFDTSSATKCFEAVNILKERLEGEE